MKAQTFEDHENSAVTQYWRRRNDVMQRLGIARAAKTKVWLRCPQPVDNPVDNSVGNRRAS